MADRPTLVKPPPLDPSKSSIENVLELTELSAIGPVSLPSEPFPDPQDSLFSTQSPKPQRPYVNIYFPRISSPTPGPSGTPQEPAESTAAP